MSIMDGANGRKYIATGPFDAEMPYYYVVIADYMSYAKEEDIIDAWVAENTDGHRQGMMLIFVTEESRTLFLMKWA